MANEGITFRIVSRIGVISEFPTGWTKEVNLVSWNGNAPRLDIRDWDDTHEKMSKGITLNAYQTEKLVELIKSEGAVDQLKDME